MEPTIEILDPETTKPKESKWMKFAPALFWGAVYAWPVAQVTSAYFNYKTLAIQLEIEQLKAAADQLTE
jgi:hypothetical protein